MATSFGEQGSSLLVDVMSHPVITLASDSFKNLEEKNVSFDESDSESSTKDRYVYIFQREFAVVNPALVDVSCCYLTSPILKWLHSSVSLLSNDFAQFFYCMRISLLAPMKQQLV
jgi:hypothetical protein